MDGHEQLSVVEDCANFLKKIQELKLYMIEFYDNGAMKPKVYLFNYAIKDENRQPIIEITLDKCTFSTNDGVQKA